jgi:transcriptional regulator with XRE-family HTH domain
MEEIRKGLGKRIRFLRKSGAMTQEQLAEKAGLCYKYIGEIERGEVNPSLKSMLEVASALNVNIQSLFPDGDDILPKITHKELKVLKEATSILSKAFENIK